MIFTITLPKVLRLDNLVHLETLAAIHWYSCVTLKCQKEIFIDVSQLMRNHGCNVKHLYFVVNTWKLTILLLLYYLHWIYN